jgi:hypothetical protein
MLFSLLIKNKSTLPISMTSKNPGIYIPFLYKNITSTQLKYILETQLGLGIFAPDDYPLLACKILSDGTQGYSTFIDFASWQTNPNAQRVKEMLLNDEEVKIVFSDPYYFILKRKHEITTPPQSQSPSPSSTDSFCQACEDEKIGQGPENQLGHDCRHYNPNHYSHFV